MAVSEDKFDSIMSDALAQQRFETESYEKFCENLDFFPDSTLDFDASGCECELENHDLSVELLHLPSQASIQSSLRDISEIDCLSSLYICETHLVSPRSYVDLTNVEAFSNDENVSPRTVPVFVVKNTEISPEMVNNRCWFPQKCLLPESI